MEKVLPYTRSDGQQNVARILFPRVSVEGLDPNQIQVVGHIADALNSLTPIAAQQLDPDTIDLLQTLETLEKTSGDPLVTEYANLVSVIGAPFDASGNNYARDILERFPHELGRFARILAPGVQMPPQRGLYPFDMSDEEFASLEGNMIENSTVVRENGVLQVRLNEQRFCRELSPAINHLLRARNHASGTLAKYLDAKVQELSTGFDDHRRNSTVAWLQHSGVVDFLFDTALETYVDPRKIRGSARGGIFVRDAEYEEVAKRIRACIPAWAEEVPWDKRLDGISEIPQLRFVNVLRWSGEYEKFPRITLAQSLPNDRLLAEQYGSINNVFVNIVAARNNETFYAPKIAEFFHEPLASQDLLRARFLLTAAHEIGHSIGPVMSDDKFKSTFKSHMHILEEARAELFSLWALPRMREAGIMSEKEMHAGYYELLLMCAEALTIPVGDHASARNIMFHYFIDNGGVIPIGEDNKQKYVVVKDKIDGVVTDLLGAIGTCKARMDVEGFEKILSQYCRTDERDTMTQRFSQFPLGQVLIFPEFEKFNGRYTGRLLPVNTFRGQSRSLSGYLRRVGL